MNSPPSFPVLRPSSWMNPNFRASDTLLHPFSYGEVRLGTRTQWKKVYCPCSIHPWWCVCEVLIHHGWINLHFILHYSCAEVFQAPCGRSQWTSTHQCIIHWMSIITQLWMNLNRVNIWFHHLSSILHGVLVGACSLWPRPAIQISKEKILTKVKLCFMGNVKSHSACVPKTAQDKVVACLHFENIPHSELQPLQRAWGKSFHEPTQF
jgi:hypothetical protein